jgi:DNA invertase Pin-like site-specific DNA recombinase
MEAEWCGARKGRRSDSRPPASLPAMEAIIDTSRSSRGASGGRIDGSRLASIDLPAPGGPTIRMLYPIVDTAGLTVYGRLMLAKDPILAARPRAYSYIRMSTDVQLKGDSRRRQLELSERYASERALELDTEFRLEDIGVSAFKGANTAAGSALARFLDAVRGGQIARGSYLLVESLDRLSRQDVFTSLSLFTDIIKSGISIVTLADGQLYSADKPDFSQLVVSLAIMSRAHEESQTKSHRLSEAWASKRRAIGDRKLTAQCPAWLELLADRRDFVIVSERAAVVRSIFEDSAAGIGNYSIARRLNEADVPPFGRSSGWQVSYINKILGNRAVLGEFQPHRVVDGQRIPEGEPIASYFPAVIDQQLYSRAQAARGRRRTGGGGRKGEFISNLFSGLAQCAYCGGRMHFINKGPGPKGGSYLTCDTARRGLGCERVGWRYDEFEASFLAFVQELDLEPLVRNEEEAERRSVLDREIEALSGTITDLERRRDRTYRLLIEDEIASDYLKQEFLGRERELQSAKASLEAKRTERQRLQAQAIGFYDSKDHIKGLVARLRGREGEVYKLRAQIAARLKSLASAISLASVGQGPLTRRALDLVQADGSGDPVSAGVLSGFCKDLASDRVSARYFSVAFRDGSVRIVHPDRADPFISEGQVYGSGARLVRIDASGIETVILTGGSVDLSAAGD